MIRRIPADVPPAVTARRVPDGAVLRVRGLRKSYGDRVAVDGADLTLRRGEWVGLLGPNGAGKTTLIRTLAGRLEPDAGTVELLGRVRAGVHERPAEWDRLGVVPQEIALYDRLTARENLSVFGGLRGLRGDDLAARVDAALDWTGLAERDVDRAGGFSGGMKRRLNIACGVLHDPDVILLDEPTVGVDPQSRERIWAMLRDLHGRGRTLLLTTHQLDEAERVCERIVVFDAGKTVAEGTLDELIHGLPPAARAVKAVLTLADAPADPPGLIRRPDGRWEAAVADIAADLPALLASLSAAGAAVSDLEVRRPDLQAVFLHLTGHALRE